MEGIATSNPATVVISAAETPGAMAASVAPCVDVAMPAKVLNAMFKHPLTDKGLETFLADWKKAQSKQ